MKNRKIIASIEDKLRKPTKKIIFLWGPRQVGKSTILNFLRQKFRGSYFNFDDLNDRRFFTPELAKLRDSIALRASPKESRFIFIDEVQKYPESTQSLKLLADSSDYIILATGSSELRAKTNNFDTLAGRYSEFILFPLAIDEFAIFKGKTDDFINQPNSSQKLFLSDYLEEMMIYGSYPSITLVDNKIEELKNIAQNSIVKDIVNIYELKNTDLVYNLLRLLAMQIGNLINISEIASSLGSTKITIDNYLSILSKNKIIFLLEPLAGNKRKGYLQKKKVFFYDLGVRNVLVEDFRPISLRPDFGAVFENLIIAGVWRQAHYQKNNNKLYYYREIAGSQKELDLIIEKPNGRREGFEIKFNGGQINKLPDLQIADYKIISQKNAVEFLV